MMHKLLVRLHAREGKRIVAAIF